MVTTISATYGVPVPVPARVAGRQVLPVGTVVLAGWEDGSTSVLLVRRAYTSDLQLMLVWKALAAPATSAITEAERLDVVEAPRRDAERRQHDAVAADAAREKARTTNKAAFRP